MIMALDLSSTAKKLIRQLAGKSEDLLFYRVRESGASVDPNTGQATAGTTTKTAVNGALTSYSKALIDGTNVMSGDLKLLCDSSFEYQSGDYVEIYGVNYTIVEPKIIEHAGVVQLYIFQVRKS